MAIQHVNLTQGYEKDSWQGDQLIFRTVDAVFDEEMVTFTKLSNAEATVSLTLTRDEIDAFLAAYTIWREGGEAPAIPEKG